MVDLMDITRLLHILVGNPYIGKYEGLENNRAQELPLMHTSAPVI